MVRGGSGSHHLHHHSRSREGTSGSRRTTPRPNHGSDVTERHRHNHNHNPRSHPFINPGGLISSLLLFVILVRNSSSDNLVTVESTARVSSVLPPSLSSSGLGAGPTKYADGATNENLKVSNYSSDLWTLYAGETQRVYLPRLVRSLRVTAVEVDPRVRAAVFRFAHRCPPLTGRPLPSGYSVEVDLRSGDFVYDSNNFARGSDIDVGFERVTGRTDLYLLKGLRALKDIQTGTNTDPSHWKKIAIAKRTITPVEKDNFSYKVKDGDIYTLVYDNGYRHRTSSLDAETELVFSTYNLYGHNPVCDNLSGSPGMQSSSTLGARRSRDCVVLEAFSASDDDDINGDAPIQLRIETYRNWILIVIFSTIPWLISCCFCSGGFWCCYCCCCGWFFCCPGSSVNDDDDDGDDDDDDLEEPLLSPQQSSEDFDRPGEGERRLHGSPDQQPASAAAPMPTAVPVPLEEDPSVVEATPIDDLVTDVQ